MEKIRFTKPCDKNKLLKDIKEAIPNVKVSYRSDFEEFEIGEKFLLVDSVGIETINKIISLHNIDSKCYNDDVSQEEKKIFQGKEGQMEEEKKEQIIDKPFSQPVDKPVVQPVKKPNVLDPIEEVAIPIPSSRKFLDELVAYIKSTFFDDINEKFIALDKKHSENDTKRAKSIGTVLSNVSKETEKLENTRNELIVSVSEVEAKLHKLDSQLEENMKKNEEYTKMLKRLESKLSSIKLVFDE